MALLGGSGIRAGPLAFPSFLDGNNAWAYDANAKTGASKGAVDFIDRELKMSLTQNRESSLARAAKDPSNWLNSRAVETEKVKIKVAKHYALKMGELDKLMFPFDEAVAIATKSANRLYEEEMEMLEFTNPGMATIWSSAAHMNADRNTKFNLGMGEAEQKVIYKQYKARKGKKSKKAAAAIAQ